MKKFEIHIKEINLNEDFEPIEEKHFVNTFIDNETIEPISDKFLTLQLEHRWDELINKYLLERTETAFIKPKSLADYTKQVRKEVCEILDKRIHNYLSNKCRYAESLDVHSIIQQVMKENLDQIQRKEGSK